MIHSLLERDAITDLAHRWFWAIDMKQPGVATACCEKMVNTDWRAITGRSPGELSAYALSESVAVRLSGVTSLHQCTNPLVTVGDTTAQATFLIVGRYRRATMRGSDSCTLWSRLTVDYARADHAWRITALRSTPVSADGNPGIIEVSRQDAAAPPRRERRTPRPSSVLADHASRLRALEDRVAIGELMNRFGRGLDTRDYQLYRSCLADRLVVDFSEITGWPPVEVDADLWTEFARLRQRTQVVLHQYSNLQVELDGDRASCLLYLIARHRAAGAMGDPVNANVGWYDNEFVRTPDGWKITTLRHPVQWIEGNETIKEAPDAETLALVRRMIPPKDGA